MSRRRMRTRLLIALTRLYPAWWQERYREEFTDLIRTLSTHDRRGPLSQASDIIFGALDAHLHARPANMAAYPLLRKASYSGLAIAIVIAADNVLTNLVIPGAANDDTSGVWGQVNVAAVYLGGFALLAAIGARATRHSATRHAGAKAGAAAGFVIATVAMLGWFAMDNLFLGTISQQPAKMIAFAASGQSSMRAYLNLDLMRACLVTIPEITVFGILLGSLGGALARRRAPSGTDARR
jgi:hypothetical protein